MHLFRNNISAAENTLGLNKIVWGLEASSTRPRLATEAVSLETITQVINAPALRLASLKG